MHPYKLYMRVSNDMDSGKTSSSVQMSNVADVNMTELALRDQVNALTDNNRELNRLLKKAEFTIQAFLNPPDPIPLQTCCNCASHRQAFELMRASNQQESDWTLYYHRKSNSNATLQMEKISELTRDLSNLERKYRDLEERKTDPFCRDTEVIKIRESLSDMEERFKNANKTAYLANCEAKKILGDLQTEQERVRKLEIELSAAGGKIRQLQDTIDAYQQVEELKNLPVALCTDFRCKKRDREAQFERRQFEERVATLNTENSELKSQVKRFKDSTSSNSKSLGSGSGSFPVFMILEQSTKPLVANFEKFGFLRTNLMSFFAIYPAHDEEYEETAMYMDFLLDLNSTEREANVKWIYSACHEGKSIPDSMLDRFRVSNSKENTSGRLELVCRSCFATCILALGGNFVKRGNKTLWVNVRARR